MRICLTEPVERLHVPEMILVRMHRPFSCQKMKGSEFEIGKRMNGPAVTPVRPNVFHRHLRALAVTLQQRAGIAPLPGCLLERRGGGAQSSASRRSHRRVLLAQQFLRLGRPRHQFTIETGPVGAQLFPQSCPVHRGAHPGGQEIGYGGRLFKEASSRPRVADAGALIHHAEAFSRRLFIATHNQNSPRTHMLLFADHSGNALMPVVGEGFRRMLQKTRLPARFRRRHGRRQVNQPFRIGGKAAHHFQRGGGVLFPDRDGTTELGRDGALAQNIFNIKHVVMPLLRRERRGSLFLGEKRFDGIVVSSRRGTETNSFSG